MVLQDQAVHRSIDKRLLLLCVGFVCWSLAGLPQLMRVWVDHLGWMWSLPLYIVVHLTLAVMIMRTTGWRLWSSLLCVAGLVIGEWFVLLTLLILTGWTVRGFV